MPNPITSFIETVTSPATGLLSAAKDIIDKFVQSPEDKAKAALAMAEANQTFTLEMAKLDAQNFQAQSNIIIAEAKSDSWMTRNWRPIVALAFAAGCMLCLVDVLFGHIPAENKELVMTIAGEFLDITKICLGGYYFGRTLEKSGPHLIAAWKGKRASATVPTPQGA